MPASGSASCTASPSTTHGAPRRRSATTRASPACPASRRSVAAWARLDTHPQRTFVFHFLPVHGLTYFRESHPTAPLPVAEAAGAEVLSLPLSPAHTLSDVDDVVAAVRRLHGHFTR